MTEPGDEDDLRVRRMDDDAADLLDVGQTDPRPGFAAVGRLEDAVADAEIRPVEAFAGADVDHLGMRRRDRQIADRAGRRVVEDRPPGAAVVVGLPDAAVVDADEEDVRLRRDADAADRAAGPKRADQSILEALIGGRIDQIRGTGG